MLHEIQIYYIAANAYKRKRFLSLKQNPEKKTKRNEKEIRNVCTWNGTAATNFRRRLFLILSIEINKWF